MAWKIQVAIWIIMNLPDLLKACVETAQEAGELIKYLANKPRKIEYKGPFDLVTDADRAANKFIVDKLMQAFPNSKILAEESEDNPKNLKEYGELLWVIDPIDGTTNYSRNIPHCAVSIAAYAPQEKNLLVGCVFNPFSNECFWASRLNGAFLNGGKISVSHTSKLEDALVETGFFNTGKLTFETSNLPETYKFLEKTLAVRRFGASSLALCWVACGRNDIFWEKGLKAWDTAAGALIIQEAGGLVTNCDGSDFDLFGSCILSTNGELLKDAANLLNR